MGPILIEEMFILNFRNYKHRSIIFASLQDYGTIYLIVLGETHSL